MHRHGLRTLVVAVALATGVLLASAVVVGYLEGCRAAPPPAAKAPEAKVVNARCPIMGNAIDPDKVPASLTREFKGQRVGFCCPDCPAAWDKLSDAEKQAKLQAVLAPKP